MATKDPVSKFYRLVPYLDYATREDVKRAAQNNAQATYLADISGTTPRVRPGYWYDLQKAGATAYSGSNELTFATGSNQYGFPYQVTLSLTIPQNKVFDFYGVADYAADQSLQAIQITQNDVAFPLLYLSPHLYNPNADASAVFNGALPPVLQGINITINLYGTAAATEPVDMLFEIAEAAAQSA